MAVLVWFQSPDWSMTLLWIGLGLALSLAGDALKRGDLKWQSVALALISLVRALRVSLAPTTRFSIIVTYRFISVSLPLPAFIYWLAGRREQRSGQFTQSQEQYC